MKRLSIQSAQLLCAVALIVSGVRAQETVLTRAPSELSALRATVRQLQLEVSLLRREVMRLQLDRHQDQIRRIQAELGTLRDEQTQLAEQERVRLQDLTDLEELLARGNLGAGEQASIEPARGELAVARAREIEEQSEVVRVRERELRRRLVEEEEGVRRLVEAWKRSEEKTQ